jgi:hypothetical protein
MTESPMEKLKTIPCACRGTIFLDAKGCIFIEFCHEGRPSLLLAAFSCSRSFVVHCVTNVQEREK